MTKRHIGIAHGENSRGYSTLPSDDKAKLAFQVKCEGVFDDLPGQMVLARVEANEKSVRAVCEEFLRDVVANALEACDMNGIVANKLEKRVRQACEDAVNAVERSGAVQRAVREIMEKQIAAHVADAYDIVTTVELRRKV